MLHGLYEIMPEAPRNILVTQQKVSAGSLSLCSSGYLLLQGWPSTDVDEGGKGSKGREANSNPDWVSVSEEPWYSVSYAKCCHHHSPTTWTLSTRLSHQHKGPHALSPDEVTIIREVLHHHFYR